MVGEASNCVIEEGGVDDPRVSGLIIRLVVGGIVDDADAAGIVAAREVNVGFVDAPEGD